MKCGNEGFALVPARSPDDPTASFLFNMVFVGHGYILSAHQNTRDVMELLPELCQTNRRDNFWGVMIREEVTCERKS